MPDANDLARDLWIALAQPESLDWVVETYRQIEDLAEAGTLPAGTAGDLRAQAFSAMKGIAGEDPIRSKALILRLLLPLCLAESSDTDGRMSVPYYGEILREWLEALSTSGSTSIRDEVLEVLQRALSTSEFKPACWTIGDIGFRTEEVVARLWSVAEREPGEGGDASLAALVALGEDLLDRERLIDEVHRRARLRRTHSLIHAIGRLGDPSSLEVIEEPWLRDLSSSSWVFESSLLIRVVSTIADANPDRPEVQDRAWEILSELRRTAPERMETELALGGDLATLCDSPRVVPDLLGILEAKAGNTYSNEHFRYILYRRVRDCVRPRQLAGWSISIADSVIAVILEDATRDTRVSGPYSTMGMHLKRYAWDVLLSLGHTDMLSPRMFEDAIATETSPFVRQRIIEWLACFRYREIPPTAGRWVTEHRRIARSDGATDLVFRTASSRLLQSAESREAFDLLLRTGFSLEGSALLSSLDALSGVASALTTKEDPSIAEELVVVLSSGTERSQRVAAAAALVELSANGRIPEHLIASIWQTALAPDRDDPELSRVVSILGFLPRSLLPDDFEEHLLAWAGRTGQLAQRAVETLARQGFLLNRPDRMPELVGLTLSDGRWDLSEDYHASDRNGFAIGLLFEAHPDQIEHALSHFLRVKDWEFAAQVVQLLDRLRNQGRELPATFIAALVARIGKRQTAYTTETELFDILGRWDPSVLAGGSWELLWASWMPEARVALADSLGQLDRPALEDRERAMTKLLLLTQDGIYAVRRSAYRALANLSARSLQALCDASIGSPSRELRRRGAEACGWIDDETDFDETYRKFASDPEKAVRESAKRTRSDRQSRRYAAASFTQVKAVKTDTDEQMLTAWPYGRALAPTGDDSSPRAIKQYAGSHAFHGHIAHWLDRIAEGVTEHWRDVTQKWPDPWYSWDGAIVRGMGKFASAAGRGVAVEYCVVKEPAKIPTEAHSWHGVAWATEPLIPFTESGQEHELILADGSRGQILVSSLSLDKLLFEGKGPYPR